MRNSKKGFTIIEMVIVIAIIGILATVLIPTYGSVVASANASAAQQAARSAMMEWLATFTASAKAVPNTYKDSTEHDVYYAIIEAEQNNQVYQYVYDKGGLKTAAEVGLDLDFTKLEDTDKKTWTGEVYLTTGDLADSNKIAVYKVVRTGYETQYYVKYTANAANGYSGADVYVVSNKAQTFFTNKDDPTSKTTVGAFFGDNDPVTKYTVTLDVSNIEGAVELDALEVDSGSKPELPTSISVEGSEDKVTVTWHTAKTLAEGETDDTVGADYVVENNVTLYARPATTTP